MRRRTKSRETGDDSIVAIVTPPGQGGVAIVRVAGPLSGTVLARCFRTSSGSPVAFKPFLMRHGFFHSPTGELIDEVMAVHMPFRKSYTGLEQAEIFCHGGRQVVRSIMDTCIEIGARSAEPGEFTRLAFDNGRIDLTQAEAVAEIIAADTAAAYKASREHLTGAYREHVEGIRESLASLLSDVEASIDFPEEDLTVASDGKLQHGLDELTERLSTLVESYQGGRIVKDGFRIVIAGRPNAGKSSLFNLLLKQERALVNPHPGTTRDYLSEWIDIDGFAVNVIDTAGIRESGGKVERLGQERSRDLLKSADLVIWMVDAAQRSWRRLLERDKRSLAQDRALFIYNKIDLLNTSARTELELTPSSLRLSCANGKGIKELHALLAARIRESIPDMTSGIIVTSARHKQKLSTSHKQIKACRNAIVGGESPEIVSFHLKNAIDAIDEITGRIYTEEILERIFGKFCIGK